MRRRRRSLGSPVAVHERAAATALSRVKRLVQLGSKEMDRGRCGEAFNAVAQAAHAWGEYAANHVHGPGAGTEHMGPGANAVNNDYHDLRRRFSSGCLLSLAKR